MTRPEGRSKAAASGESASSEAIPTTSPRRPSAGRPPPSADLIAARAQELLLRNRRIGYAPWAGRVFDFTCPSLSGYPFQWFWDSCFHAIVLSHFDLGQAKSEMLTLTSLAREDGFIGHVIFWEADAFRSHGRRYAIPRDRYTSTTIQPPGLAQAVEAIWQADHDQRFLQAILPRLWRFHRWLLAYRDPDGDALISTLPPDASGMDSSPRYDALFELPRLTRSGYRAAMRRLIGVYRRARAAGLDPLDLDAFSVEDVAVNAILAEACLVLARLSSAGGAGREAAGARGGARAGPLRPRPSCPSSCPPSPPWSQPAW